MSRCCDRHGLYFGNAKKLVCVSVPWNRIFRANLFRSLAIRVADSDKIALRILAEDSYLVLAPEPGSYNASADTFQVPELPLPIEV
jgi:hypothetical protein